MIKNIAIYITIQLSLIILLIITLSSVKLKNVKLWTYLNQNVISEGGQTKLMFNDLKNFQPDKNTIFVVGSSHAYRGYDPRIFNKSGYKLFNMGTSGQNMKDSYSLVLANADKIKTLIIDIYPGVLLNVNGESTLMLIQNADRNSTALTILKNNLTLSSLNNMAARIMDINHCSLPYNEKYIANGYVQKDSEFKADTTLTYEAFEPGNNFAYFDSILSFVVNRKIKTCLASHPLKWNRAYKEYYNVSYLPVLNTVLKKYPQVYFYDYTLDHPNNDSLFSDVNHLNQKGVNWYNNKLIMKLKLHNIGAPKF